MSNLRHPTRDALLRDGLNQIREQRGISMSKFAKTLNALTHAMAPGKVSKWVDLNSLTDADEYASALITWHKQVERWAAGTTEFPAWLEEPWVTALEELGDEGTRAELANRHGYLAVSRHSGKGDAGSLMSGVGNLNKASGGATVLIAKIACDGVIDGDDLQYLPEAQRILLDVAAQAMGMADVMKRAEAGLAKA